MTFLIRCFTLRRLFHEWIRTSLAAGGVALGIAVFLAIRMANTSVMAAFQGTVTAVAGTANLEIDGGAAGIDERLFPRILAVPGIRAAAPVVEGTAAIASPQQGSPRARRGVISESVSRESVSRESVSRESVSREPVSRESVSREPSSIYLLGIDPFRYAAFQSSAGNETETNTGKANGAGASASPDTDAAFLTDPGAVDVTEAFAAFHHLRVGSPFLILSGARTVALHVAGILRPDPLVRAYGGNVGVMDIAAAQESLGRIGRLDRVLLQVEPEKVSSVRSALTRLLPVSASVERPSTRTQTVDRMLGAFRLNLQALSLIALFVGMFLIYNTLSTTVVRARRDLGIVRSLGATRRGLFLLVLLEAAFTGAVGSALGLALGYLLAGGLLGLVASTVTSLYVRVQPAGITGPAATLAGCWLLGVSASVISALAPAFEAAEIEPATIVRQGSVARLTTVRQRSFGLGAVLLGGLGAALSYASLRLRIPWLSFAAAFAILLCFALCAPAVCAGGGRLLRLLAGFRRGPAVRIAAAFLLASLERIGVVAAALSAAIAMLVALSVMVGSFRQTVDQWVGQTVRGDVYISPAAGRVSGSRALLPPQVVAGASRLPGAALVDAYRSIAISDHGDEIILGARHAAVMLDRPGYRVRRGSTRAALRELSRGNQALVSGVFADRRRLAEGDYFSLDTPRARVRFRVAGIFEDYTSDQGLVILSLEEYRRFWNDSSINSLAIYARPGVGAGDLARQAEAAFRGYRLVIRTNGELKRIILAIFDQTFQVTYVLELIAVIVALLGIASTLMTLTVQRQRQLATIRALGATRKQIAAVVMVEAAVIAVVSWVLGSLCGTALAAELVYVVLPGFFHWTVEMAVSPGIFVESLALMMPASLLAAIAPAAAASKVEVSRALRME